MFLVISKVCSDTKATIGHKVARPQSRIRIGWTALNSTFTRALNHVHWWPRQSSQPRLRQRKTRD